MSIKASNNSSTMKNTEDAQNCWEYWNCDPEARKTCPAYELDLGKECWMVAGSFTDKNSRCPRIIYDYKHCWECPWFEKLNPNF